MATAVQNSKNAAQEDLSVQIGNLREDVAAITRTLGKLGEAEIQDLKGKAQAKSAELSVRGQHALEEAEKAVGMVEAEAMNFVRTRPLQSMAIAAGLGLLVGFATRGR